MASSSSVENFPYRRIATEEAFTIPEVLEATRQNERDHPVRLNATIQATETFPSDKAKLWMERLVDLGEGRIADMDAHGIDQQVLLLAFSGVQDFEAGQALQLSKLVNERVAEAQSLYPTRFAGLATVAPQNPTTAAQEIERAIGQLGLKGVLINSHTNGEYLDLPKYRPIFETLSAHNVPLYLHPRDPSPSIIDGVLPYALEGPIWGYAAEAGLHCMRLIFSGLFDELPNLKIVIGHGGENIPAMLWRIDNRAAIEGLGVRGRIKLKRKPSEYFIDNFAVTSSGNNSPETIRLCHDVLGADNILFAVDYPFEENAPALELLKRLDLPADSAKKFYQTNAERIFKLKSQI